MGARGGIWREGKGKMQLGCKIKHKSKKVWSLTQPPQFIITGKQSVLLLIRKCSSGGQCSHNDCTLWIWELNQNDPWQNPGFFLNLEGQGLNVSFLTLKSTITISPHVQPPHKHPHILLPKYTNILNEKIMTTLSSLCTGQNISLCVTGTQFILKKKNCINTYR